MAIGFRTSGMFGPRPQQAAPNPSAMPIGVQQMTQKQGFFQRPGVKTAAGILGDTLLTLGGGKPMYAPMMHDRRMQEEDARIRAQLAQQQQQHQRENFLFEEQYEAANPKPKQPTPLEQNFAWFNSLPPEQKAAFLKYQDAVNPLGSIGPDGRFYARPRADDAVVSMPVTDDEWNSASPMGGSGGNVTGGFPIRY